jgi:hypothetical protein
VDTDTGGQGEGVEGEWSEVAPHRLIVEKGRDTGGGLG